jgi:hypothetical protein
MKALTPYALFPLTDQDYFHQILSSGIISNKETGPQGSSLG